MLPEGHHEWRGVPEHVTLTAPDELAVFLHGAHHRRCVNECTNRCKPLLIKASAKCSVNLKMIFQNKYTKLFRSLNLLEDSFSGDSCQCSCPFLPKTHSLVGVQSHLAAHCWVSAVPKLGHARLERSNVGEGSWNNKCGGDSAPLLCSLFPRPPRGHSQSQGF